MSYITPKVEKVMVLPINVIFRHLQSRTVVVIWIVGSRNKAFEGIITGFDEYMNLVLEEAYELNERLGSRRSLKTILLRGDNIALIRPKFPTVVERTPSSTAYDQPSTSKDGQRSRCRK